MIDVFEALCTAVAWKVQDFNAQAMTKTGTQIQDPW